MVARIYLTGVITLEAEGHLLTEGEFPGRQARLLIAYLLWFRRRPIAQALAARKM